jgi:hypothetical protein
MQKAPSMIRGWEEAFGYGRWTGQRGKNRNELAKFGVDSAGQSGVDSVGRGVFFWR